MKILRESLLTEHDWKQPNDDSRIARIQLLSIQEKVQELLDSIKDGDQLDAWIQMKITKAEDGLNSVRNYIVFEEPAEGETTSGIAGPEVITDNPPADVAPESPVPLKTPIDPDDELDMGDLIGGPQASDEPLNGGGRMRGPGPEGDVMSLDDEEFDLSAEDELEEYGDEHPAQGWREEEADRRYQIQNGGVYDVDDELEYPENYMEESYVMESLDSFAKKMK